MKGINSVLTWMTILALISPFIYAQDATKVIGLEIPFVNNTPVFEDYFIVYNYPPDRKIPYSELQVELLSTSGSLLREYSIHDPRISFDEDGTTFSENTQFFLVLPFLPQLKTVDLYEDDTNDLLISVNLI